MENDFIDRNEFREFTKRLDDANERQNHRISALETSLEHHNNLIVTVEKMAVNMEQLLDDQKTQNARLDAIESHDGEMWRNITSYIITVVLGIVVGYIFKQIGM